LYILSLKFSILLLWLIKFGIASINTLVCSGSFSSPASSFHWALAVSYIVRPVAPSVSFMYTEWEGFLPTRKLQIVVVCAYWQNNFTFAARKVCALSYKLDNLC
jgi:hypothetical protein